MDTWGSVAPKGNDELITIGMASIPGRMVGMQLSIEALLPQCDQFDVYLNGYPPGFHIPLFDEERVNVFHGPDLGARGKLYMAHRTSGYFLTVDDDLLYPNDYVITVIQGIEKYEREALVGFHGTLFAQAPDPMQPQTRMLLSHQAELMHDLPVHMLGTGITGWHTSTIQVDWRRMTNGKIDEQVAILGQNCRVPQICLAHPADWVCENDELKYVGALRRNMVACAAAVQRQQRPWHLYLPDSWKKHQRFP